MVPNCGKNNSLEEYMNANRPSLNVKFQAEVRTCVEQLDKDEIGLIIDKASDDFINTMFVMTEDDIKDNGGNRYEWSCIVIPADIPMLQQYIERWFRSMKVAGSVKEYMNANRQLTNANFRTALRTYISQLDTEEIKYLFISGSSDFLNTMFVLTENDIESDHAYYRFESFGIVIPDDILQLYTRIWMYHMKKADALIEFVGANRSMSVIMQTELEPYINQINLEK
ncbi:unnamed protein product [Mytilus edulis]|uniref:Uncharacterized protein n=1 Tax=Mytilus edulis TaxID=6550 RepID=A0A8S3QUH7_MYTED|nr:unnamed protein product [Mytilus edulis]